jgi:hypothetical protein
MPAKRPRRLWSASCTIAVQALRDYPMPPADLPLIAQLRDLL